MNIEQMMHAANFECIWYAHPGPKNFHMPDRWHAGIWTGPQMDLICVKRCDSNAEADEYLSPGKDTIEEAVCAAYELWRKDNPTPIIKRFQKILDGPDLKWI